MRLFLFMMIGAALTGCSAGATSGSDSCRRGEAEPLGVARVAEVLADAGLAASADPQSEMCTVEDVLTVLTLWSPENGQLSCLVRREPRLVDVGALIRPRRVLSDDGSRLRVVISNVDCTLRNGSRPWVAALTSALVTLEEDAYGDPYAPIEVRRAFAAAGIPIRDPRGLGNALEPASVNRWAFTVSVFDDADEAKESAAELETIGQEVAGMTDRGPLIRIRGNVLVYSDRRPSRAIEVKIDQALARLDLKPN